MERTEVLDLMSGLKLYGMRSAYDETLATALKRKHEPQRFVGDLLKAEISEKQARSNKYQLTVAKLPPAKDVDDFAFKDTPINEDLVRDLAGGGFIAQQRNVVLVGSCPSHTTTEAQGLRVVGGAGDGDGDHAPARIAAIFKEGCGPRIRRIRRETPDIAEAITSAAACPSRQPRFVLARRPSMSPLPSSAAWLMSPKLADLPACPRTAAPQATKPPPLMPLEPTGWGTQGFG
jgi:IstB-like ATP binding protein